MASPSALFAAVDLVKTPILVGVMRHRPLPPDVLTLIQIAAGSSGAEAKSAAIVGQDGAFIRAAAKFYIRQVLWTSDADHYRVLGVAPDAPAAQLAEHLRWYMKWLHPDVGGDPVPEAFAARVLKAWDAVKTPERRRRYDEAMSKSSRRHPRVQRAARLSASRIPWISPVSVEAGTTSIARQVIPIAAAAVAAAIIVGIAWSSDVLQQAVSGNGTGRVEHQVNFDFADPAPPPAK